MASDAEAFSLGRILCGDALQILPSLHAAQFQLVVADAPYYQVLTDDRWDSKWASPNDCVECVALWARECRRVLLQDGSLYAFYQLGQREHAWLHVASRLARRLQSHDMTIWH